MSATDRTYIVIKGLLLLIVLLSIVTACSSGLKVKSIRTECAPSNLEVKANDHTLFLKWDTNCPDDVLLSGYYIFLEKKPIYELFHDTIPPSKIKPFNHTPYPGDTDPEDSFETMLIQNLDNGVEYFISLRTIFPDHSISVSSNEIAAMCRPEGQFDLAFRYADLNDGFNFKTGQAVRADAENNDLYFFNKDGFDFIASPHRLNGFLRHTKFYSLGKTGDVYQHRKLDLDIPSVEKMPVIAGESYLIETADGNYAKIRIENISGEKKERFLSIKYIYQTKPGIMRF
jgi:hypothetical protein